MGEICQRCGEGPDPDRRTLWMACFYEMMELDIPFDQKVLFHANLEDCEKAAEATTIDVGGGEEIVLAPGKVFCHGEMTPQSFYTLRVCKQCRGEWMAAIKTWFESGGALRDPSPGTGIFIRRNGANVEISEEEWRAMYGDREPHRVIKPEKSNED